MKSGQASQPHPGFRYGEALMVRNFKKQRKKLEDIEKR